MRVSPLSIWCHKLSPQETHRAAYEETILTHPDPTVTKTICCYHLVIGHLLNNLGDRQGAVQVARQWVEENGTDLLKEWIGLIDDPYQVAVRENMGWIKIAFVYALSYLERGVSYEDALKEILLEGGDTDTNACIIGAVLGAACGYNNLPAGLADKVMAWNPRKGGHRRPEFLRAKNVPDLLDKLLEIAPTSLDIISSSESYAEGSKK